jgi:hypothetical protein
MNTELLDNLDLLYYAKKINIRLHNVLSKDLFSKVKPKEGCYIINLQNSTTGNGTHWTALILFKTTAIYFDSYGMPIPSVIKKFINRFERKITILYSIDQIQTMESVNCGWYCIFFLYFFTILHKKSNNYKYLLSKHNQLFSIKDKRINDEILHSLISSIPAFKLEKHL